MSNEITAPGTGELPKLTRKQTAFIDAYLTGDTSRFDATKSAIAAGYSKKTAYSIGWENLRKPEIKAEIDRRLDEVKMSKGAVLAGISDIANGDIADFMEITSMGFNISLLLHDERGELVRDENGKPVRNPKTKLIKKLKQKVTTINGKGKDGEDKEIIETEIELYSALDAYRDMGKHHGVLKDTLALTDPDGGALPLGRDKEADARHDRAISSLADAIRESVLGTGAKPDSAVDTPE